jgi:beta-lactamase regulating signal transducer with metallopeptidase domain/DUF4097 and DUF4098 domain-containing protein YvlB
MIEQINHIAQVWWSGTIAMFWQVGVLIILIGCVDLIIRRWAWPQLRYSLWLMVLVKLVLPPTISLSTSVTSGLQPLAKQIVAKENRREDLNNTTSTILAHFEASVAESPAETVPSRETFTEQQPVTVVTSSENVDGDSLKASHVKMVWQVYLMAVWLAGMFILGGWLIIKLLHLRKEDRRLPAKASLPESFYDATARCAKSLGLRRVPKVVLTRKVACPAVFGIVRPILLMPAGYLSKMTRKDTEHMLLHELAHIKRGDLFVHSFYMLLQVVYWYNPLLWLVRSQMHHLRELCCDATVARLLRGRISEYRQTLIDVARRYLTKPTEPGLGLLGLFEDSNRLLVRLNWLKKETWRYQKMKKLTVITTIVLMFAFVLPMAQARDKPATENSSAETVKAEVQPAQSQNTPAVESEQQQKLQELKVRLQQLEIQKQKLQQQLQALTQARQAESQAVWAKIKAKEAAIKAKDIALKANDAALKAKDAALKAQKEKDKDGKCVATREMNFVAKVKPGIPFVIRNSLGNITLKPSKDNICDVKAVIQAKAETVAEAQKRVEQGSMDVNSSDDKYYLKPVKSDGDKWSNLYADLTISVPAGVQPDVKTDLGSVEMSNLRGKIKALTNLGSVKAVNTTGDIELTTKMGNIEFFAPEDLSAKFKAETKMGSIKSDLPLNINNKDMFNCTAKGTIGSGRDTIRMTTDMGSIRITNKLPESSANDPEPMIPGDAIRNNADKLDTQLTQLEAKALKTGATLYFIKQDQEGSRFFLKRFETMTTPLSPGSVLDIKSKDGNVTVQGSDTDQCSVTSAFTIKTPSMDQTKDLSKKISLQTTPGNKKLTLKTIGPGKMPPNHTYYVDLNINVPRNTTVTLHKEDGDIRITNLEGQIQIGSEDGNITCENVTGDTSLTSEDGDITYKNITGNARINSEDGNVKIMASHLTQLYIKKADGNIHCDQISGDCDVSIEDGNVTISYAEGTVENCTCIVRGEDGNVKINNGTFAKCQINRESGMINCNKVKGNFDVKLEEGQVVVDYADNVPESCSINAQIEEGSIRLTAPAEIFPADAPSKAKKKDEGAEWTTKTDTPSGGTRTVSLQVDEGSVKVEKR